eukprot:TRINITY_DN23031_c0_g1_i2.p1 TRINITY_DN23031_c0_g1~~TRINITY_DN23031_c0_g1_i2.p1  ORF type:complete len:221 (+),score=7.82 TRINITY_DN23031_c0_g1_i2:126-788(+)
MLSQKQQPYQNLVLYYLPLRARAEPIRILLHHANVKFVDKTISFQELKQLSRSRFLPYDRVPVLEVNSNVVIAQSGAIMRLLASWTDLMPQNPLDAALCDAIYESSQECVMADMRIDEIANLLEGNEFFQAKEHFYKEFPRYLNAWAEQLGQKSYFLGDKISYADFGVWHILDLAETVQPGIFDQFQNLKSFKNRITQFPEISRYINSRMQLRVLPSQQN